MVVVAVAAVAAVADVIAFGACCLASGVILEVYGTVLWGL